MSTKIRGGERGLHGLERGIIRRVKGPLEGVAEEFPAEVGQEFVLVLQQKILQSLRPRELASVGQPQQTRRGGRSTKGHGGPAVSVETVVEPAVSQQAHDEHVAGAQEQLASQQNLAVWLQCDRLDDLRAAKGLEYDAPDMPDFPEGKATYQIVGIQPAAEELAPIQALHDLYNSEFERLKTAYVGRERARIEHEAYLKANPQQPKDITLNFWRSDKPTSAKGGAK